MNHSVSKNKLSCLARKSLRPGRLRRPVVGKVVRTRNGQARVLRILSYDSVVEEMELNGVPVKVINKFRGRVVHFLGDTKKYFECELIYANGEIERIDWSEFFAQAMPKRSSRGSIRG